MDINGGPFFSFLLNTLGQLAFNIGANISASLFYEVMSREDLEDLITRCIKDAVAQCVTEYNDRQKTTVDDDEYSCTAEVNLPEIKRLFSSEEMILPSQKNAAFFDSIIDIGCPTMTAEDKLEFIRRTLAKAGELFKERIVTAHPAFEAKVVSELAEHTSNHRRLSEEHRKIEEKVDEALARSRREMNDGDSGELAVSREGIVSEPKHIETPFSKPTADALKITDPRDVERIRELFVPESARLSQITEPINTILVGQRGTGKTMILKYLSVQTQLAVWVKTLSNNPETFLGNQPFVGVYYKFELDVYPKYRILRGTPKYLKFFEHRLVIHLFYAFFEALKTLFPLRELELKEYAGVKSALASLLGAEGVFNSCEDTTSLIEKAQFHLCYKLIPEIERAISGEASNVPSEKSGLVPFLSFAGHFAPFLELIKARLDFPGPFFLLLDDFDILNSEEQKLVFSSASARRDFLYFKIGAMVYGIKTKLSDAERTFRAGHDYKPISLDWTRGGLDEEYRDAVLRIAEKRLEAVEDWPVILDNLLLPWDYGEDLKIKIKAGMKDDWESGIERHGRTASEFINKYLNAKLFQELRRKKTPYLYAGIDDVIAASSGNFRQFLMVCDEIFVLATKKGQDFKKQGVLASIQNDAIRAFSDDLWVQIEEQSGDTATLQEAELGVTGFELAQLVESLCDVFFEKLHHPGHGDPEILCFAVERNDLKKNPDVDRVLQVAVRESILHEFDYPSKKAGKTRLPAFMLNRALGPRRNLSIRRMKGRIEIKAEDLRMAIENPENFKATTLKKPVIEEAENDNNGAGLPLYDGL
jgi:hypothetical protein